MDGRRLKLGGLLAVVLVAFMVVMLMPWVVYAATTDRYHGGKGDGFTRLTSP